MDTEDEALLAAALDLGEHLLECGGEVSRVEDTIRRICGSYNASRTDVFVITSSIVVTMERDHRLTTQTRRIRDSRTDFTRLEELNALSRHICTVRPPIGELRDAVARLDGVSRGNTALQLFGYSLASGAFTVFFGGHLDDALCAAGCALLIYFCDRHIRRLFMNGLLYLLFCSVTAGFIAMLCGSIGLCGLPDKVMIGDIMLLIPGIALTTALRDLFMGDTISGLLRLLETLLQATVIACGFAISMMIGGGLP